MAKNYRNINMAWMLYFCKAVFLNVVTCRFIIMFEWRCFCADVRTCVYPESTVGSTQITVCACVCECVSEPEQMLYGRAEVSSCADEGLKVRLSVFEAHRAQVLQLLLELRLLRMDLTGCERRVVTLVIITVTWSQRKNSEEILCLWEWEHTFKFEPFTCVSSYLLFWRWCSLFSWSESP